MVLQLSNKMNPEHWQQLDELFHAALARRPAERAAFLDSACFGEERLRQQVEALLEAHDKAGSFIEAPAMEVEGWLLANDKRESPTTLMIGKTISHYRIIVPLGSGGMGEVYVAQDTRLGRKVALKILPDHFTRDEERLRRFEQEARAASALNHPNIVTIHEVGQDRSFHFIAEELIEGITLREHSAGQPLPINEALDIAMQVASALAAAHAKGIVHRDIKPENVMLDRATQVLGRQQNHIKVLDFGIAKLAELSRSEIKVEATTRMLVKTDQGLTIGTAPYMSPEQARGESVDGRTDIWSLGIVLYEMLTGKQPFLGETSQDVIAAILRDDAPRLPQQFPETLKWIVKKALRKDREERYQTAKEIFSDLRELYLAEDKSRDRTGERLLADSGSNFQEAQSTVPELRAPTEGAVIRNTLDAESLGSKTKQHRVGIVIILSALLIAVGAGIVGLKYIGTKQPATKAVDAFGTTRMTRLTTNGKAAHAAISPDGKYLVHVMEVAGKQSLWLKHIATGSDKEVVSPTDDDLSYLTFSPDGNYIYYSRASSGNLDILHQVPVLGGADRQLITDIDSVVTFSPDGKRLAFVRGDPTRLEASLIIADADGSGEQKLATHYIGDLLPAGLIAPGPAWSPDGEIIVVGLKNSAAGAGTAVLMAIPVKDKTATQITSQQWLNIGEICWLRDGSGLVFIAIEGHSGLNRQIWYVSYPGGEVRRVTNDLVDYKNVSLTADSSALVTVQTDRISNIWLAPNGDAGRSTQVTSNRSDGWLGIAWSPDGKIVYSSRAIGNSEIWVVNADGTGIRRLTSDTHVNVQPCISFDGRYIVFASNRSGKSNIWRMDIDGRNAEQLTSGRGDMNAECTSDNQGEWVIFTSNDDEFPVVAKVPIAGGDIVRLTDYPSSFRSVSRKDGQILITYVDEEATPRTVRFAIIPFTGGPVTKRLDPNYRLGLAIAWTVDGKALSYIVTQSGVSNIWNQLLDGSTAKRVTDFKSDRIFSFAWSPDGKNLALSRGTLTNDVVLINNFRTQQ